MLNENGKLAYITPNSWLTSTAGTNFRNYLKESKTLLEIYQYGHYKVFAVINTYTCITLLSKTPKTNNMFVCYRNTSDTDLKFIQTIENLEECMINGNIYLTDKETLNILKEIDEINIKTKKNLNRIRVKNGFATLNDKLFIIDDFIKDNKEYKNNKNVLSVIKASNGEMHYFFYPYDENGKPLSLLDIDNDLVDFMRNKAIEMEVDIENPTWYLYGRTQALNDVKYNKVSINNLIRNEEDIKIYFLFDTVIHYGIYSGYCIPIYNKVIGNKVLQVIRYYLADNFVEYIKAVGKYKNGGYYTFSSKELEMWFNYCAEKRFFDEN